MNRPIVLLFYVVVIGLLACSETTKKPDTDDSTDNSTTEQTRSYYLGFTPWPYQATVEAVSDTYNRIQNKGDIVAHHLMDGIPWDAASANEPWPAWVENEVTARLAQTQSDQAIYLAIDALNSGRDGMALNWGESGGEALPAPWSSRDFDDPEVIDAYTQFALDVIERFDPDYFNYASEVSELALNDPAAYTAFITFAQQVYNTIKAAHPDLPVMVSIALKSPDSTEAATIATEFAKMADSVDMLGVSVYPYAFYDHADKGDPAFLPTDWLSQVIELTGDKPVAITETGWIGEDLDIAGYGLSVDSDADKQADYVDQLMTEADALSAAFIIWFSIVDYDDLWNNVLGQDDLSKIWKDTGLYDELFNPRPALTVWEEHLARDRE